MNCVFCAYSSNIFSIDVTQGLELGVLQRLGLGSNGLQFNLVVGPVHDVRHGVRGDDLEADHFFPVDRVFEVSEFNINLGIPRSCGFIIHCQDLSVLVKSLSDCKRLPRSQGGFGVKIED